MLKKWFGAKPSAQAKPDESVDEMRRRAQHRLIGAVVLVGLGVVGFPLVFDTNPRPLDVDMPIVIPNQDSVPALALPPVTSLPAGAVSQPTAAPAAEPVTKPAATPIAEPVAAAAPAATQPGAQAANAKPAPPQPQASVRVVVQVGSFTDARSVRRVRQRLERAGLKTYTQVIRRNGQRLTRVRVGPFDEQAKAEAAAAKVRALGLDVELLRL
jgi:DedD protein